ncbi:MAG: tetraacyldisaccharide 4'-kinase [Salinivirgaceae bacterium]
MLRWLLLPFSFFYGLAVWLRNKLFDVGILPSKEFKIPLIVVGNITVGGTGKTPHIEYLANALSENKKVAVLSRGYKRKSKGFVVAQDDSTTEQVGDEPRQIKRKFPHIAVVVHANRVNGVHKLMQGAADFDPDVILLDDAFQHRYVKAGLNILLVDYNRPLENDYLLPYGRLRESMYEKKRAHIVIVTKAPRDLKPIDRRIISKEMKLFPYQGLYFSYLKYGELSPVFCNKGDLTFAKCKELGYNALLVTGIANPAPLKEFLAPQFEHIEHLNFTDHRNFTAKDVKRIEKTLQKMQAKNVIVLTTEKDAVRMSDNPLFENLNKSIYYVPVEVDFLFNDKEEFEKRVETYIKNNKKTPGLNRSI